MTLDASTFDRSFLRRLEHLPSRLARFRASAWEGSLAVGAGRGALEFVGHRPYVPGDDVRRVDWNAFARRRRLVVRELARESGPDVLVVVDASASMRLFGKDRAASRIAATLARLALDHGGVLRLAFASGSGAVVARPMRGDPERHFPVALQFLTRWPVEDRSTEVATGLRDALATGGTRCSAWIVSDFWFGAPSRRWLAAAATGGRDVTLVHVLSRHERDLSAASPGTGGAVRLEDSESGRRFVVWPSGGDGSTYRLAVDQFVLALRGFASRHRLRYRFVGAESELPGAVLSLFLGRRER